MEYSLTPNEAQKLLAKKVLILILMEYSLTFWCVSCLFFDCAVLILILMEYSLTEFTYNENDMRTLS